MAPPFTAADSAHMARALELARRGRYGAPPNPCVGCVIVRDGAVVGEGWHAAAGGPHAEVDALARAGERAANATVYVTLEPCAHHGKTPPCADALIAAGVSAVVAATPDPFPDVAGRGFAALRAAGIEVRTGLMEAAARALNEGYLARVTRGRPFVRLKVAASLDGATAMENGESQWITGPEARRDVQRWRARSGAVLTGIGTILADDPALDVREPGLGSRQPLRAILDTRFRTPPGAKTLGLEGTTVIYGGDDADAAALRGAGAATVRVAVRDGRASIPEALADLAARQVNDVFVECGPTLAGNLLSEALVDELVIYRSPHIMGSEVRPMFATPDWRSLHDRRAFRVVDARTIGEDVRTILRPAP